MSIAHGLVDIRPLRTSAAFRRLWMGGSLSGLGGQLTLVAVLYQAWELTDSPAAVGVLGLARAVPMVVFGLVGGVLADAVDRRRLVLLTMVGQLLAAVVLVAQAVAELGSFGILLGIVAIQSTCSALGAPARRTFVPRLLPAEQVGAGIALNHLSFQLAMLVGPAVAGMVTAAWGVKICYLLDAVLFVAAVYGVFGLPSMRPTGEANRPGLAAIWDGWRFVVRRPALSGAFATDVFATVLAMPIALFPAINDERFGGRPETLGLFLSAIAVGGITAGMLSGTLTRPGRPGVVMLITAGVWGVGLTGFGLAQHLWLALGCLAVAGAADTLSVISRGTIVQLATPDSHRGRVSALEHIVGVSGPDLGNFRGGLVAGVTSASFAAISGGILCVVGIAGVAATNRALRRFTTSGDACAEPESSRTPQPESTASTTTS
ncbi:MFS transporter [Actinopolymorpha sp. B9G3]|uniref:MFS transporter n=1 Tax=Actinopolymorpha sp. B9G3 TaxID=3158970 RepID=UPI0032D98A46